MWKSYLVFGCALILSSTMVLAGHGDKSRLIRERSREIDRLVQDNWKKHGVKPSPNVHDQIFMRRAYLDVVGTIPTGREAIQFVSIKNPHKRQILIDYLLDNDGYVSHFYNYWADVLRVQSQLNNIEFHNYVSWIKESLEQNKPYDKFVYELITAKGRVWENGAAGYYLRDRGMPLDNTANTVAIFLGTQIGCAQCHDHPFEEWTQRQFYEMAAFTHSVNPRGVDSKNPKAFQQKRRDVTKKMVERKMTPDQQRSVRRLVQASVWNVQDSQGGRAQLKLPGDYQYDNGKPGQMVTPKVIYGDSVHAKRQETSREAYARWMTSAENPLFAKVIANRLWKKVMGVGLIEPVDDIQGAEASNPELLEFLTSEIIRLEFDMKEFIRLLMNTDVYQRRAVYQETLEEAYHFPGPTLRRMTSEQLWDSLVTLSMDDPETGKYEDINRSRYPAVNLETLSTDRIIEMGLAATRQQAKYRAMTRQRNQKKAKSGPNLYRASEMRQPAAGNHFLRDFGQSDRNLSESSNTDPNVTQILTLLNGTHHFQIIRSGSLISEELAQAKDSLKNRARIIYLSVLGRDPAADEFQLAIKLFKQEKQVVAGDRSLVWILLNTPEFMFIQ
jgi:hypothetical protein